MVSAALPGRVISVRRKGLNKTLNHGARPEHVHSITALLTLLECAALVTTEPNRDPVERRSIPVVHTLHAHLLLDGALYLVRLIVKDTNAGLRFYDHDLTLVYR